MKLNDIVDLGYRYAAEQIAAWQGDKLGKPS